MHNLDFFFEIQTCQEEDGGKGEYDLVGDGDGPRQPTEVADLGDVAVAYVAHCQDSKLKSDQTEICNRRTLTAHGPLLLDKLAQVEFVVLEQQDVWHHREDGEEDADAAQDGRPRARREAEAASSY